MTVAVLTVGSRGDVQPYLALARGLQETGYNVKLAAPANFEAFALEHEVPFFSLGVDFQEMATSVEVRRAITGDPKALFRAVRRMRGMMRSMLDAAWKTSQGADAVVYHPKTLAGTHIAEALRVPCHLAIPVPVVVPTRAFPAPLGPLPDLGPFNPLTYWLTRAAELPFHGMINRWRKEQLGLSPRPLLADPFRKEGDPLRVLYAFSPTVVPPPPDWPDRLNVTGYWFLEAKTSWRPPEDLVRFLEDGAPPVYVGFGSLAGSDPEETTRIVLDALQQCGARAVLATGWGGLMPAGGSDEVFVVESVPHDWLFPRCSLLIHHGGAGTTAAGLRAGKPTLICPFFGDQSFWGKRVYERGAGPEPIPQKALTSAGGTNRLAAAIRRAVTSRPMQRRAAQIGRYIRREEGVANAVRAIESSFAS